MELAARLDRQAGSVAAMETAFALLVLHMERRTGLNRQQLIDDMQGLSELPDKDLEVRRAERRMLSLLRRLP